MSGWAGPLLILALVAIIFGAAAVMVVQLTAQSEREAEPDQGDELLVDEVDAWLKALGTR